MDIQRYLDELMEEATTIGPEPSDEHPAVETVLKNLAVELWSDALGERFWLVADEADAARLPEARGTVYTAAEARLIVQIGDSAIVSEVHDWKRQFDGVVTEVNLSHEGAVESEFGGLD